MEEHERLELMARLYPLLDEIGLYGAIRSEMIREPERAVLVLERVLAAPGIRNTAAFAITRWREPVSPPPPEPEPEPEPSPPTLADLEYVWSLGDHEEGSAMAALVRAYGAAIGAAGGFSSLKRVAP